ESEQEGALEARANEAFGDSLDRRLRADPAQLLLCAQVVGNRPRDHFGSGAPRADALAMAGQPLTC
ncbi:MAG: hypothetical protein ACRDSH_19845, partial [Pseudonocardiaceae bacterium]